MAVVCGAVCDEGTAGTSETATGAVSPIDGVSEASLVTSGVNPAISGKGRPVWARRSPLVGGFAWASAETRGALD
jgi:hypothetical protein